MKTNLNHFPVYFPYQAEGFKQPHPTETRLSQSRPAPTDSAILFGKQDRNPWKIPLALAALLTALTGHMGVMFTSGSQLPSRQIKAVITQANQTNTEISMMDLREPNPSGLNSYFNTLGDALESVSPGAKGHFENFISRLTPAEIQATQDMLESLRSEDNWQENWELQSMKLNQWIDQMANAGHWSYDQASELKQTSRFMFEEISREVREQSIDTPLNALGWTGNLLQLAVLLFVPDKAPDPGNKKKLD